MTDFLSDQAIAERVLWHVANGTTDSGGEVWREPVANYTSEARLQQELEVLRRSTVPFCPSAVIRKPGDYVARNAAGVPIIVVRGKDGQVRAFRNACRHRGTELANGTGCTKAFVCPYHGWAYGLDGELIHVPHEEGFPGLDREQHGLVPVYAEERAGIVLVNQSGEPDQFDPLAGIDKVLPADIDHIDTHYTDAKTNWKMSLEGSLEGYHIRFLHPESFYPYGYDNLNVVEQCERNSRVTYPFRRIEKLKDIPPEERRVEGRLTYIYHLYPNVLIAALSQHTDFIILEPLAPGRTLMIAYCLANTGGDPVAMEAARRDAEFVNQQGAPEDLEAVESIQRSVDSGANEYFTFGHYEGAIIHLHRNLQASIDALE